MAVILRMKLLSVLMVVVAAEFEYNPDYLNTNIIYQQYQELKEQRSGSLHYEDFINPQATVRLMSIDTSDQQALQYELDRTWVHNPGTVTKSTKCGGLPGVKRYKVYKEVSCPNYSLQVTGKSKSLCFDGLQFKVSVNDNGEPRMSLKMSFHTNNNRHVDVITNIFKPPKEDSELGEHLTHARDNGIPCIAYPFDVQEIVDPSSETSEKENAHYIMLEFNKFENLLRVAKLVSCEKNLDERLECYLTTPFIVAYELFDKILALHDPWKQYIQKESTEGASSSQSC